MRYLTEEDEKPLRLRLLPAIRHPEGRIRTGKRGDDHSEIRDKYADEEGPMKGEAGFYDMKEKAFLSRSEAAKHAPRQGASGESTEFLTYDERKARDARLKGTLNTPDTMSDMQRMRKYGTFEESVENIRKYLVPAIQHESGKIIRGGRLDSHSEIRERNFDKHNPGRLKGEAGYVDRRNPDRFMSREQAAEHGADPESTGNLSGPELYAKEMGFRPKSIDTTDLNTRSRIGNFLKRNLGEKKDFMIAFRQKIDAKRLAPTRSGSKGGSADGDE
jgi:hypothetical protein